jgi:hypothetical protein
MKKNINKTLLSLCILALGVLPITNCAAILKGTSEDVSLSSEPSGMEVFINGVSMGSTPLRIRLGSKDTYTIEFKRDGFETKSYRINNNIGAVWIILDIMTGFVPILIDAATGAWFELDQKNINAVMENQNNGRERTREKL